MGMTLDKLMQMQQYSSDDLNKMKNPFREWSRLGYAGSAADVTCRKPVKMAAAIDSGWGKSDHLLVDDLPTYGSTTGNNSSSLHAMLTEHTKTFLHFAIPIALVFVLLLAFCVAFFCILTRRRYVFRQNVVREVRRHSDSNNNARAEQGIDHNGNPSVSINIPFEHASIPEEPSPPTSNNDMKAPLTLKVYMTLKKLMIYMVHQIYKKEDENCQIALVKAERKCTDLKMDSRDEVILKLNSFEKAFPLKSSG